MWLGRGPLEYVHNIYIYIEVMEGRKLEVGTKKNAEDEGREGIV